MDDELRRILERVQPPGFVERLRRNMEQHKPLLDRLAREGDCLACAGTDGGCDRHRLAVPQPEAPEPPKTGDET